MKKIFGIFIFLCHFLNLKSQLAITPSLSPTYLVDSILLGPGVVAFNIQYTGAPLARGYFNGKSSNIGLDSGVILSTGKVISAIGPNNTTSVTSINGQPGNAQLTAICGQPTNDAAILEFDFIPSSDTVRFRYVFASEEYYEGVCTPYNDVFAFLINGPGITGTTNIALIPGTNKAVSISSVNGGVLGDPIYSPSLSYTYCNLSNTAYYIDNTTPPGLTVQYDGFTKIFTAKSKVIACNTYHIKLGIADGGNDNTWDSAVFLEAGSFNTHYLSVSNQPKYTGGVLNSAAVEGCGSAIVSFKRYDSIPYPRTINYTISGSASPSDYTISAPNIYFSPGSDTVSLRISPVYDNQIEGIETVSLTLIPDFIVCTGWTIPGGVIRINDQPDLNVSVFKNSTVCPYDSVKINTLVNGGLYPNSNSINWSSNQGYFSHDTSFTFYPQENLIYTLHVTDSCGSQAKDFTIDGSYDCPPYLPNIITPNNNSVNDFLLFPNLKHFGEVNIWIFNRWGEIVFQMKGYNNSFNANNLSDGVYFYVIETSQGKKFKSSLTVLR